ncbi:MAG TPA: hypothetical protein VIG33_14535 [Pseudobdellovibrionaceae bacterium]|jgi:hypothetical protein
MVHFKSLTPFLFFLLISQTGSFAKSETQGKVSFLGISRPELKSDFAESADFVVELEGEHKYYFNKNLSFQVSPWVRSNWASKDSVQKFFLEAQEIAISYKKSSQKVMIGFHRQIWEGTDLVNPMSLQNPQFYLDPLVTKARSSAGLFYSDQIGSFSWDFSYIPKQGKSVLPGEHSAWWPRSLNLPLQTESMEVRLPEDIAYQINNDEVLDRALDHNVGFRLMINLNSLDVAMAGFEGSSQAPLLIPVLTMNPIEVSPRQVFQVTSPIAITPTYFRRRAMAGVMTWSLNPWVLRLSAQHIQPMGDSPLLPGWSELFVAGIERNFALGNQDLMILLQGVSSKKAETGSLSTLEALLERALMLGLGWRPTETVTFLSVFYQEQRKFSFFFHNELKLNHNERWSSQLAVDIFEGKADSALGTYNKNDQFTYQLSWAF